MSKKRVRLDVERKSLKQFYRLWFEYLKISQQKYKWSRKEKEFYMEWGNVKSYEKFDLWWKEIGTNLIGDVRVEIGYKRNDDSLNLAIPLTQPITTSISQIRTIIEKEVKKRLEKLYGREIGDDDIENNIMIPLKKYQIPPQSKYQTINDDIVFYKEVYLKRNNKVVNMELVNEGINYFKNRKVNKNIPRFLKFNDDEMSMVRSVRRSIKRVEEGLKRVREGKFIR